VKRRLLYGLMVLLLLPVTGLAWLMNSESGMRWSYQQALPHLPDSLTLTGLSGTLAGPLTAHRIRYQDRSQILDASHVTLNWNPWGLLKADFDISDLQIQALDIDILDNTDVNEPDDQPISLPQITLPLGISLDSAVINAIDIRRDADSYQLRQIRASATARADRLEIKQLDIDSEKLKLSLQGRLHPVADYAHDIKLRWQTVLPSGASVEAEGEVIGDLRSTRVSQSLQGAVQLQLAIDLQELLSQPNWQSELEVTAIDSKLLDPRLPPLQGKLSLSASGDTKAARLSGRLNAESPELGAIDADFKLSSLEGERRFEGVSIDALEISAQQGQFSASGQVDWAPSLRWQAEISASRVNPATLLPQWPGDIAAQLSSRGGFEDGELVVTANISRLQGELRGYPVSLQSELQWKKGEIDISRLEFSSGETRVSAEGQVSETLDLHWSLDSRNLAELYPQAQGRLTASGELGGLRESPAVKAAFSGRALQLPGYEIAEVEGDLIFDLLNPQQFKLNLSGQTLRLQGYVLQSLDMVADPDRIRANLVAAEASVQLALDGRLETDHWRGKLVQADIQSRDFHNWTLQAPGAISLSENALVSDMICLRSDHGGEICSRIEGQDETWKIGLDLKRIPLAMFGQWIPAELQIEGLAQASADLEYRVAQHLLGKIDLELPPGMATYRLTGDYSERFVYRSGKLELWLESSGIKAETALELVNGDRFEGRVAWPAADLLAFDLESQALQASLRLDTRELGMVDAMVEEIDGMQGVVAVDVDITGNLANPRVKASAQLIDGALNIPKLKLGLAQLDIQLRSENYEKISYRVEALSTGGKLTMRGDTLLNADQGWPSSLQIEAASFDLAQLLEPWLPQDTRIEGRLHSSARLDFKAPDILLGEIELSAPSGRLSYPLLEGELENWEYRDSSLSLILDQQGIRGRSEISIGAGNTLDGNLNLPRAKLLALEREKQTFEASAKLNFTELAIIEALLPDIGSLRGSLTLNLNADGTLAKPNLAANAEMLDAAVDIPRLGLKLERIKLHGATASDNQFEFQLDAHSGNGNITIKGNSRLEAASGWPTTFSIKGDEFEVARIPEATARVSPDLVVEIQNRSIDIRGDLLLPYAKLQPKDITTATQVSSDSVIIDSSEKPQPRWQITTRVNLILGDRVNFFGYGFEGKLGGNLLIEEAAGQLTRGIGEIRVAQGRYRAYGQRLDIENGRLLFTGGPLTNPGLDIRAVRKTGSVTAGIHATGRLLQPKLELFSIPAMGQTDALSYLLLGRPLESASNEDGAMMAKAALALGLSGGDKLARSIGDLFGLDEMRIESGDSGDQASLVVGRYLSPRLYASYGIGLIESFNTFNLRYEISEQWQLKAESGESHGADLMYTFER
jgi:translocation and assembly module TamB